MAVCKRCGRYTDPYEWPEEYRNEYKYFPNYCFGCYQRMENEDADQPDDGDDFDDDDE